MSVGRIDIKSNNGWDFCQACTFCETETCDFCDEGDQFELSDDSASTDKKVTLRELALA